MRNETPPRPWYRERLVWMLIALPASAIVAGIITIVIAVRTTDGLVADDYYKQGLAINQTIARDELARSRGLRAVLELREGQVRVSLTAESGDLPPSVRLTLVHPTRAGEDQAVRLARRDQVYVGELGRVSAGRWGIRIEDEDGLWRMSGSAYLPSEGAVRIPAERAGS